MSLPGTSSPVAGLTEGSADFTIRQGDTEPSWSQQLSYSDRTHVDLTDATVQLVLRDLTSSTPLPIAGTVSTGTPSAGIVTYSPAVGDTSLPGTYMANWVVTFAGGGVQTFPTDGYLWVEITENLQTIGGQQLVGLPEVKEHLNISRQDRKHDTNLIRLIHAVRPVIESITGPILVQQFDEWHDGGHNYIMLRRRPSAALGTSPIVNLIACSEYSGPIEWPLAIVGSPDLGQMYSCMLEMPRGRVVRRTTGGGTRAFPSMPQSVHVVYQAGQSSVPQNVRDAVIELCRVNYNVTQNVGRGRIAVGDTEPPPTPKVGFPAYVRQMLTPNRKFPSIG